MIAVQILVLGDSRGAQDGRDLDIGVREVYEVVVEGVAGSLALGSPKEGFVGVGEGGAHGVRGRIGLLPGCVVYHASTATKCPELVFCTFLNDDGTRDLGFERAIAPLLYMRKY